jgi:uncharacterized protein (TIGR02147 family)
VVKRKLQISVFDYTDYRKFLSDYYVEMKSATRHFSYRFFARKAGISSVGLYKDVVEGRKLLGRNLIIRFSQALDLSPKEAEYFENMVFFNEARTMEERKLYFKKMMACYESKAFLVDSSKYEFYSKWYYSAIMPMLAYYRVKDDFAALGKKLNPPISPHQAKKAIKVMEKLHLIEKDEEGYYKLVNTTLSARVKSEEQRVASMNILNLHKTMLDMAHKAYDINRVHHLDMSTLTLSVSEDSYKEFKKDLAALRNKFASMAKRDSFPDRIYQLNCNLFPLSKIEERK